MCVGTRQKKHLEILSLIGVALCYVSTGSAGIYRFSMRRWNTSISQFYGAPFAILNELANADALNCWKLEQIFGGQTYFTIAHTLYPQTWPWSKNWKAADKSCSSKPSPRRMYIFVSSFRANKTKKGKFCRPLKHGYDRKIIQQICLDFWSDVKKAAAAYAFERNYCVLSIFRRACLCCLEFICRLKCKTRKSNSTRLASQEFRHQCRDEFFMQAREQNATNS